MMNEKYLNDVREQFAKYKTMGEKAMAQLTEEQLFWQYNEETNSLSIIVKHLWGNMLSRWTDFLTTDGEKEWRQRDQEFENDIRNRKALMEKWEEGWQCLFHALDNLAPEDMERTILIRNKKHSVMEAINRQLSHYSYHVGQIVFLAKMIAGSEWKSLSIPKGQSQAYNQEKFGTSQNP
jgi:hypothetical protein